MLLGFPLAFLYAFLMFYLKESFTALGFRTVNSGEALQVRLYLHYLHLEYLV